MKDSGFMVKKYGDCRFTVTVTELEFKDSASALISFIENFTSKLDDNAKKLKKGDKDWLEPYKKSTVAYLVCHTENKVVLPDDIVKYKQNK